MRRSRKTIGTSEMRKPCVQAEKVVSIWNE